MSGAVCAPDPPLEGPLHVLPGLDEVEIEAVAIPAAGTGDPVESSLAAAVLSMSIGSARNVLSLLDARAGAGVVEDLARVVGVHPAHKPACPRNEPAHLEHVGLVVMIL